MHKNLVNIELVIILFKILCQRYFFNADGILRIEATNDKIHFPFELRVDSTNAPTEVALSSASLTIAPFVSLCGLISKPTGALGGPQTRLPSQS